jgi:hypothetical protein
MHLGSVPARQIVSRLLAIQLAIHRAISDRIRQHSPERSPHLTW